jgi:hypothetical protein
MPRPLCIAQAAPPSVRPGLARPARSAGTARASANRPRRVGKPPFEPFFDSARGTAPVPKSLAGGEQL